jgi:hypothetical protein
MKREGMSKDGSANNSTGRILGTSCPASPYRGLLRADEEGGFGLGKFVEGGCHLATL